MKKYQIAASILSADFANLGEDIKKVLEAGADSIHFDVMDNHYVPNLTFGPPILSSLRKAGIKAPVDVHLMTTPVDNLIEEFAKFGANSISFHPEATKHIDRSLQLARDLGLKTGLALNPVTHFDYLEFALDKLDFVLIMSVNPGFGGQKFISSSLKKISAVRAFLDQNKKEEIDIEVDGGVKEDNVDKIVKAGANIFVMGSAIFSSKNYHETITRVKKILH